MLLQSHVTEERISMSNTAKAFENGKAVIGYIAAGDPDAESSIKFISVLAKAGVDMIELGIPFSDPIADEPEQQRASLRGLDSGANLETAFNIVKEVRKTCQLPIAFVSYLNPVYRYGYEEFFSECHNVGVDALFVIDLPFEEKGELIDFARKYSVDLAPTMVPTSDERLRMIASESDGFIYFVPTKVDASEASRMIDVIKGSTKTPVAIAFGDKTADDLGTVPQGADGIVIGSGLAKIIGEYGKDSADALSRYVRSIKDKM